MDVVAIYISRLHAFHAATPLLYRLQSLHSLIAASAMDASLSAGGERGRVKSARWTE